MEKKKITEQRAGKDGGNLTVFAKGGKGRAEGGGFRKKLVGGAWRKWV